jgi:Tfp pilus assembly protein PilF
MAVAAMSEPEEMQFKFNLPRLPAKAVRISVAEAERALLEKLASTKDDPTQAMWQLAQLYKGVGQGEKATAILRGLLKRVPGLEMRAQIVLALGQTAETVKDYALAERFYREALSMEPMRTEVWYFIHNNLGYSLIQLGRHADAERCCRNAIDIDPARGNAHKNLGLALEGQGRFEDAARAYVAATQANAADARAYRRLVAARPFEGCRAFQRPEPGSPLLSRRGATVEVGPCHPSNEGNPVLRVRHGNDGFQQRGTSVFRVLRMLRGSSSGDWGGWSGGGWKGEVRRSATRIENRRKPWAEAPRLPSLCRSATPGKWPTAGALRDVPVVGGREAAHDVEAERHRRHEEGGGHCRHPELADAPGGHHPAAGGFHPARREDEADAQAESEEFRHPASFEKAEHQPPDHPEGNPLSSMPTSPNAGGRTASMTRPIQATTWSPMIMAMRAAGRASETTLIPVNLEAEYPIIWATTRRTFSLNPQSSWPAKVPTVKGRRNAYMQV